MPKKQLETLTEPMYYALITLLQVRCGMEITEFVLELARRRVRLIPGTLYTTLSEFKNEDVIRETESDGRKRFYLITEKGREMLMQEYRHLKTMLQSGKVWIEKQSDEKEAASWNEGRNVYG